jgi:hypothetical protein
MRTATLVKKRREDKDREEWALVSKSSPGKVLEWFGPKKPSEGTVQKAEARVQFFKHQANRVVARFKQAKATAALRNLVVALVKAEGGEAFIQHHFDSEMMPAWDKEEFYRQGGADRLLDELLSVRGKALEKLVARFIPLWDRVSAYKDGGPDVESFENKIEYKAGTITLTIQIIGPQFARYTTEEDDGDDDRGYGGYGYDGNYVEVPEDDAFLDEEIDQFAKALGAHAYYRKEREPDAMYPNTYDHYEYLTRLTWNVDPEDLVRSSFGKLVDQAGQSFRWLGEAKAPLAIPDRTMVEIVSQKGWDRGTWKKGQQLEILRGGRSYDIVRVRAKGERPLTFTLRLDKRGISLLSGAREEKVLRVKTV